MKKGFTLAELLITVVILGILAAITLPNFTSSVDKAQANQTIAFLRVIRTGEQMFFARNAHYYACAAAACTSNELLTNLGAEVSTATYAFGLVAPTATTFTATAIKGGDAATSLVIDQAGSFATSASVYKPT